MIIINGNFYQNPTFPTNAISANNQITPSTATNIPIPMEQSFIENILRLNKGKRVNVYVSFPDSSEWKSKIFSGIIEEAGRDHLIISDSGSGNWYLIRLIYLDYVEFMERINYSHDYSEKNY